MWRSPILYVLAIFLTFSCQQQGQKTLDENAVSNTINDTLISFYASKAGQFQSVNQYDSAFYFFSKSKELAVEENDSVYVAYTSLAMAYLQQTVADYSSSEETLTEAMPYFAAESDHKLAALNLFGIAAKEVKNYEDAVRYYQRLLPLTEDAVNQSAVANNIAAIYIEQKKYPSAILLLEPYLNAPFLDTLPQNKARIMDNLGFAYYKNNEDARGLALLKTALQLRTEADDSYGSIMSHLHLADYYQNKEYNLAENHAIQAYQLATKHRSVDERLRALSFLMAYHSKVGTNTYAVAFSNLNDSITTVRNQAKNQFAKIKYDSQKANLEALKYKGEKAAVDLKLQAKQLQNYLMIFGVVSLLLFIAYLVHYYKVKSRQEQLKTTYSTETRISKMVHDELANDVFYTMNFAETQDLENSEKREQLLNSLDKIYTKTRNISKENSPIDTGATFFKYLKEMLSSFKSAKIEVIIRNGAPIDWSKVSDDKKIAVQRVLQELMVNMKKHSQASFVVIGFDGGAKELSVTYSDNGIGCSETAIFKNGLQNAENRIQAIKGQLTFDFSSPKGFKAKIIVPN